MAGGKKKKKPAAAAARGFATTSIASKPRVEPAEAAGTGSTDPPGSRGIVASLQSEGTAADSGGVKDEPLSPEEFERRLEESELQLLAEKHSQKVKREAQRQRARLETDRRLLRSQAEPIYSKKWLPPEIVEHILELIRAEGRFAASSVGFDGSASRLLGEEDLTVRLWTLQQTLGMAAFPDDKIDAVLRYVLEVAPHITVGNKDSVWGLEEALDWLGRECSPDELPDYDKPVKHGAKSQSGTPMDTPLPSGASTPKLIELEPQQKAAGNPKNGLAPRPVESTTPKKIVVTYDSDIEPDELVPMYLDAKTRLFGIQRHRQGDHRGKVPGSPSLTAPGPAEEQEVASLLAKIDRIEKDVVFQKERDVAERQWKAKKILLEKDFAASRRKKNGDAAATSHTTSSSNDLPTQSDDVAGEAERIAAELLAGSDNDDGEGLTDLFASLPIAEVDPSTGKTQTVMNGADGSRVLIRDFGKWTGVSPTRALEEACRARDSSAKVSYQKLSETSFAHRHMVQIAWTRAQDIPAVSDLDGVEMSMTPSHFVFKMTSVAAPDAKQSEAFIATAAMFLVFGSSPKEEKVSMRLPAVWRDLWSEFAEVKKAQVDAQNRIAIKALRDLVRERRDQELEDGVLLQGAFRGRGTGRHPGESGEDSAADHGKRAPADPQYYQRIWLEKSSTKNFQRMLQSRMQLPMWSFRQQVLDAVDREQVVIVCGETGCGKSTQVPAFLLEHELRKGKACKIYCTEPRRISAISLARRVSEELGESRGELGTSRSVVGYSIRLESKMTRETRLVYATTGIVMRMLEGSSDLRELTHLVLDEVHERSIDSDFLLIVLKKLLQRRKDLKVVLMSATVDADRFSRYLGGAPVLNVPGRTFPVQVKYLEDAVEATQYTVDQRTPQDRMVELGDDVVETEAETTSKPDLVRTLKDYSPRTRSTMMQIDEYQIQFDLILQLIRFIAADADHSNYSKAILVFLPGMAEIRTLNDLILGDPGFASSWKVYPLHSSIPTEDQEEAFVVPPAGWRKIVLATNIAETGITIPDVTCVIDSGKHREMRFDERRQLSRLIDTFISRANAKQRRGRAGRVQSGLCFHLFTKYRHDTVMSDQQTPEMLRLSLQDLAIRVKTCGIGAIEETLGGALDPPSAKNIRRAVDALIDVGALTASEELTPLGTQLSRLPVDVFLGKLILLGTVFKCLDMALTVAAIVSSKSPFTAPFGQRAQADTVRLGFRRADSDLLTVYNAYLAWKRVCQSAVGSTGSHEFQFCRKAFLSPQTLANIEELKGQLLVSVVDSGFLSMTDEERGALNRMRFGSRKRRQAFFEVPQRVNLNSDNDLVSQSVIAWSFYPKLLVRDVPGSKALRNVGNNQPVSPHPSSVNKGHNELRWLSYYRIMQTSSAYHAHETTAAEALPVALLCGDVRCDMYSGVLILDGNRARFSVPDWRTMLVIKVLRARLREMLTRSFRVPGKLRTAQHERWYDVWQRIFSHDFDRDGRGTGHVSKIL